jgi:DNA-binding transcriptional regulator YdaS (Cro superfamily)
MTMKQSVRRRDPVLEQVHAVRGTAVRIAAACHITREAVWDWRRVPAGHVLAVERLLGIPRHLIRPDLYEPPYHPRTRKWLNNGKRKSHGETSGSDHERI